MNKFNLTIASAVAAITAVGAGAAYTLMPTLAAETTTISQYPPIVTNIASTFNLDPAKVHEVFETTHKQEHIQRLDKLVEEGKITEEQKKKLVEYGEKIHAKREELKSQNLTHEEIHTQMEPLMQEMKTWAEEQGISEFVRPPHGKGGPKGMRGGQMGEERGPRPEGMQFEL